MNPASSSYSSLITHHSSFLLLAISNEASIIGLKFPSTYIRRARGPRRRVWSGRFVGVGGFGESLMSRHRGDWDDDFYEGEPRPRRREERPDDAPPRRPYAYDERDLPRG